MRLFLMEFKKIAGGRIVWLSLGAVFVFFILWNAAEISGKRVYDGGREYKGLAAIERNREITKPFEGSFTLDTANQIIEKYGFYSYDREYYRNGERHDGNFCNFFVTRYMTEYGHTGEGEAPEKLSEEGTRYSGSFLRKENPQFGYIEGWADLRENMLLLIPSVCILLMIAVTPVFSGEYVLRTASVTLTTVHGKKKAIWAKIAAALAFSVIVYTVCTLTLYASYLSIYRTDGLSADVRLLLMGENADASGIGSFLVRYFFAGLLSAVTNTCITLAMSALCRKNFTAIIFSLLIYLSPFAAGNLAGLFPSVRAAVILVNVCLWMPFYSAHMITGIKALWIWKALFRTLLPVAGVWAAYRKYAGWQDGRR